MWHSIIARSLCLPESAHTCNSFSLATPKPASAERRMMSLEIAFWHRRCFPFSGILFRSGIWPTMTSREGELVMPGLSAIILFVACLGVLHAHPAQLGALRARERGKANEWSHIILIHILSHSPLLVGDRTTAALLGTKNAWSTFNEAIRLKSQFFVRFRVVAATKQVKRRLRYDSSRRAAISHGKQKIAEQLFTTDAVQWCDRPWFHYPMRSVMFAAVTSRWHFVARILVFRVLCFKSKPARLCPQGLPTNRAKKKKKEAGKICEKWLATTNKAKSSKFEC